MSDAIIRVQNLSKQYVIGHQSDGDGLRHVINGALRNPWKWMKRQAMRKEEFWALKDVSFDINRGEVVGIIGRNGAGKSTLLKILSRITEPTGGRIEIDGRVASLLEVGTGFHQELTGRENIFLNGAILGMTKVEIKRKFDEIVAFSEIEQFLDTPVKRYSSGMYVRLAFAVAAHLEPEILIVDEVLAVGDAMFQKKCLGKMQEFSKNQARTVLFVSHNMGAVVNLCQKAFWLKGGRLKAVGEARPIVQEYLLDGAGEMVQCAKLESIPRQSGYGEKLKITSIEWLSGYPLQHGMNTRVAIHGRAFADCSQVSASIGFSNPEGVRLVTYDMDLMDEAYIEVKKGNDLHFEIEMPQLPAAPGIYNVDLGVRSGDVRQLDFLPSAVEVEVVAGKSTPPLIIRGGAGIRLPSISRVVFK